MSTGSGWRQSSDWLLASAVGRLRRHRPDWADAMLAEASFCTSERDRFDWAWGCWIASLRACLSLGGLAYAAALVSGLGLMIAYEWSADESRVTVIVLGLVALVLGALRPRRALFSGALVGRVVTGVIVFEALSGIRPVYEGRTQTLFHSIYWLVLLVPALCAAIVGARIGRRIGPARPWL